MTSVALRAMLIREIEQAMQRIEVGGPRLNFDPQYLSGMTDAYAHILTLIKDEDL